jgi:phosphatidylserine/phosphatidylglycerophosphate/cardiolipin synthase-like enzyme
MDSVLLKGYLSPSLVLLAMDWPDGAARGDFLGFAIERTPGFADRTSGRMPPSSWLPNRISFSGPPPKGQPDFPSNDAPIQKFLWWDARLENITAGTNLTYQVTPVVGNASSHSLLQGAASSIQLTLPPHVENSIGTWFNRAVMGSQAFSSMCAALGVAPGHPPTPAQALLLRTWLANGMEMVIPQFVVASDGGFDSIAGAIYHLTDTIWIIPALKDNMTATDIRLVYDAHKTKEKSGKVLPNPNVGAIKTLKSVSFRKRDKTNIMHNKFLVTGIRLFGADAVAQRLTQGSANYTTEGLTEQANLVHTFDSKPLADCYLERFIKIQSNPTKSTTALDAAWSPTMSVGDAGIRVFFSPEHGKAGDPSISMETIVSAVHGAKSSVIFCLFDPTDAALRDACFSVGDTGKMMFGLVNRVAKSEPKKKPTSTGNIPAPQLAAIDIYHRSRSNRDTIGADFFTGDDVPPGFVREYNLFPGTKPTPYPPVIIHHKFIVIDGETESPTIYSGSANMSGNSVFGNDENLLEFKGSPRLGRIYLAEFLRLYEHYRARASYIASKQGGHIASEQGFRLTPNASWATKHYTAGSPEFKARVHMLGED